jgi:pilus assembly protein CpaB
MQKRFLMVLLFAFVVALGASVLVYRSVVSKLATDRSKPRATVLLASRDLPVGALVKTGDLQAVTWEGPLPVQSIIQAADALNRGVVEKIYKGEPIVESRLAPKGGGAGLAATIPAGMRAVAVHVNDVVGVAGFVVPGMRVDVLVSGLPPGDSRNSLGTQTRTLLQNIEVLSAGQNMHKDVEGKPATVPVVNLLVTPEQAEILSLASNEAKIQLVLRNPLDNEKTKAPGTAVAYLFGGVPVAKPQSAPVRRAAPRPVEHKETPAPKMESVIVPVTMEVITGAKKDTVKVGVTVREEAAK